MNESQRLKYIKDYLIKRKRINELKKQKNYEQIFEEFGQKTYVRNIPSTYIRKELKKLKKEGKFELIYRKYGEKEYNKYISYMLKKDVLNETGNAFIAGKTVLSYKLQDLVKVQIPSMLLTSAEVVAIIMCTAPLLGSYNSNKIIEENSIKYETQIAEYNENIEQYTNEIKQLISDYNLTDLDIFMKLIDDMWNSIDGYGKPEYNVSGFMRLDIQNGYGVCRNMADDIAEKLNAINPEYNAQVIACYVDSLKGATLANIEQKYHKEESEEPQQEQQTNDDLSKLVGNHAVVIVEVDGMKLMLDPTNPLIGVIKNGEIVILNSDEHITYKDKYIGNSIVYGISAYDLERYLLESYFNTPSIEELKEKYGLEQQNESLEKIRNLNNNISLHN